MSQQPSLLTNLLVGALGGAIMTGLLFSYASQTGQWLNLVPGTDNGAAPTSPATSPAEATTFEQAIIATVKAAKPAVVSIVITKDVPVYEQYFSQPDNPFGDFFSNPFSPFQFPTPQLRQNGIERQEIGGGSGFIISADGMIITNKHVVNEEAADYTVFTNDGTKYPAQVVAKDPVNDIAIMKIDGNNLPFLAFADSDQIEVGQSVIAIGNALGEFRNSVSLGVVSGLARSITAGTNFGALEQLEEVIQTDAAINPGNSGGPLLNLRGQVVGVNVAVALDSQNVGFALPANAVKAVVKSVNETGKIVRPFLGIRYIAITPALQEQNKLPVDYGVLAVRGETAGETAVVPGSPADKAGLAENDIILEIDGKKLDDSASLANIIQKKNVGDTIQLKILRKGREQIVSVTLQPIPE